MRRAFLSYVVKDELGKGGFVFPSDFNFKNPEILLHLRRNFYKVLGGGKKEGVFAASLVDEAVQFGCRITVMIRKVNGFNQVEAEFAHYKLMKLLGVNIVYNHADFRMMTRRAVNTLKQFPERNLFLRAMMPLVGFKSDKVYYDRKARPAGETKYPLMKMMGFAWSGISSFSIVPLRLVTFMGFFICFLSLCFLCFVIYRWSVRGTIVGWASLVTIITIFSGVQLVSLGIIGEYLAKIFVEVKQRPLYIVDEKTGFDD